MELTGDAVGGAALDQRDIVREAVGGKSATPVTARIGTDGGNLYNASGCVAVDVRNGLRFFVGRNREIGLAADAGALQGLNVGHLAQLGGGLIRKSDGHRI